MFKGPGPNLSPRPIFWCKRALLRSFLKISCGRRTNQCTLHISAEEFCKNGDTNTTHVQLLMFKTHLACTDQGNYSSKEQEMLRNENSNLVSYTHRWKVDWLQPTEFNDVLIQKRVHKILESMLSSYRNLCTNPFLFISTHRKIRITFNSCVILIIRRGWIGRHVDHDN